VTRKGYFLGRDGLPWQERSIAANEETMPLVVEGREVTVFFRSDTAGDLTILVDVVGDGEFEVYVVRPSTTKEFITIDEHFHGVKLRFSTAAVVTAKYHSAP